MISLPITRHRFWQLVVDGFLVAAAWYLAFRLRFDPKIPPYYHTMFTRTIWIVLLIQLSVFILFGFYNRWWRYVSTRDMWGAARGVTVACLVSSVVVYFANPVAGVRLPRSVAIMDWLLLLAFVAGARMLARTLMERPTARGLVARGKEVIVVGAGDAAQLIIKELLKSPSLGYTPIGLVDDDPRKKNLRVHNVRVLGTTEELPRILHENRPDEVLIAIPSASGDVRQRIVDITREAGVPVKTLPGIYELISGDVDLAGQIRPVQVEDVLGREPVEVDLADGRLLRPRRDGARHRRRRLDRRRALPADRAHRLQAPDPGRPGGDASVRDRARARLRARFRAERPRAGRRRQPERRCATSSSATRRASSSTPPPTSTCR